MIYLGTLEYYDRSPYRPIARAGSDGNFQIASLIAGNSYWRLFIQTLLTASSLSFGPVPNEFNSSYREALTSLTRCG
jgi:hypothetical protein